MHPIFSRGLPVMVAVAGLLLGGCATGSYSYIKKTPDGQRVELPLKNGVPANAKAGTVEVTLATLRPSLDVAKKQGNYAFMFRDTANVTPKNVRVEDVSDESIVLLVEDTNPVLKDQVWTGESKAFRYDDPEVKWITYLDTEVRLFRLTITYQDGKRVVLHQGWSVPGFLKPLIRQALGEEPPAK